MTRKLRGKTDPFEREIEMALNPGHPYLSGEIESTRLDVPALGLVPLRLAEQGIWDPDNEYWGEEGDPIEEWAKPVIARGPRPSFEMEQVLPGEDPDDPFRVCVSWSARSGRGRHGKRTGINVDGEAAAASGGAMLPDYYREA